MTLSGRRRRNCPALERSSLSSVVIAPFFVVIIIATWQDSLTTRAARLAAHLVARTARSALESDPMFKAGQEDVGRHNRFWLACLRHLHIMVM